jgi:hypothetical protein
MHAQCYEEQDACPSDTGMEQGRSGRRQSFEQDVNNNKKTLETEIHKSSCETATENDVIGLSCPSPAPLLSHGHEDAGGCREAQITCPGFGLSLKLSPLPKEAKSIDIDTKSNSGPGTWPLHYEPLDPDRQYMNTGLIFGLLPVPLSWYDWFYPPGVPRSCQLLRKDNLAIPLCYLTVGLLQGLSGPFINVYPLDLGATEAQQVTISCLRGLPASFKILFGFWSDTMPLWGYRRKSYMAIGWGICSLSMCCLAFTSDLTMYNGTNDDGNSSFVVGPNAPSIPYFSAILLSFGTGFWFADVMADSVVAEKAKLEPEETRGYLQSSCYACRFFKIMIAAPFSSVIYSSHGPQSVVLLMALLPLFMLPFVYTFWELRGAPIKPVSTQCEEIWTTVCSRDVWQPMGFVYLYNVLQVGNAAWREYLFSVLDFTANQLNALLIMAYVLLYLGVLTYKNYLIHWSWRTIYLSTTLLNSILSALQVLLIYGITFGLDPFWFALGDDSFADFIGDIQFLVSIVLR